MDFKSLSPSVFLRQFGYAIYMKMKVVSKANKNQFLVQMVKQISRVVHITLNLK